MTWGCQRCDRMDGNIGSNRVFKMSSDVAVRARRVITSLRSWESRVRHFGALFDGRAPRDLVCRDRAVIRSLLLTSNNRECR